MGGAMNLKSILVVLICSAQLGACAASKEVSERLGRASRADPASVTFRKAPSTCLYGAQIDGDTGSSINLDCFKFQPEDDKRTAYQFATGQLDDGTPSGESADVIRQARNRLGFALINHADMLCEREKGTIYGNRAATSGLLDFGSSSFSIASTIVGGEQAKSILSGLAGLSTATRTNIDTNVYQNQLTSAITKMMDTERHSVLQKIQSKQSLAPSEFSADEMIVMVNQYHQACSFQKGVQLLLDAAVNKEGVDQIVRAMNLRQVIVEADRFQSSMPDKNSETYKAISTAKSDALLELFEIAKTSNNVTINPAERAEDVAPPPAPGGG